MGFLFLVGHSRAASFLRLLRLLPPPHTQLTHTHTQLVHTQLTTYSHNLLTHNFLTHNSELGDIDHHFAWQAWNLATSTCILRGRRGTYGTGLALVACLCPVWRRVAAAVCVAGVALGDIDLATSTFTHNFVTHKLFHTQHFYIHKLTHTRQEWIL